jgi:hypothetical protein
MIYHSHIGGHKELNLCKIPIEVILNVAYALNLFPKTPLNLYLDIFFFFFFFLKSYSFEITQWTFAYVIFIALLFFPGKTTESLHEFWLTLDRGFHWWLIGRII